MWYLTDAVGTAPPGSEAPTDLVWSILKRSPSLILWLRTIGRRAAIPVPRNLIDFFEHLSLVYIAVVATDNLCAERRERNPALLMTASGIAGLSSTTLPQIVIDAIEDCAFGSRFLCGQLHL